MIEGRDDGTHCQSRCAESHRPTLLSSAGCLTFTSRAVCPGNQGEVRSEEQLLLICILITLVFLVPIVLQPRSTHAQPLARVQSQQQISFPRCHRPSNLLAVDLRCVLIGWLEPLQRRVSMRKNNLPEEAASAHQSGGLSLAVHQKR